MRYMLILAALLCGAASCVVLLAAFLQGRNAAKAAYYVIRRAKIQQSTRALLAGLGLAGLALVFGFFSFVADGYGSAPPVVVAPQKPAEVAQMTSAPIPSNTPAPPTATPPPPTLTPSAPAPAPAASAITPAEPTLKLRVISSQVTVSGEPLGGGAEFTQPVKSIFVFYEFHNLPISQTLACEWARGGVVQHRASETLKVSGDGISSVSWSPGGGLAAGLYEARFSLNNKRAFVANFVVR